MKALLTLLCASLLALSLPLTALAQSHGHGSSHQRSERKSHDHGKARDARDKQDEAKQEKTHGAHGEHGAEGIELGARVEDGVKGEAQLQDVREVMAQAGMKETHHFLIHFTESRSGEALEQGRVALRIKGPDGVQGAPIELIGMDGHFGADIILEEKGVYEFTVGTRLQDGKTRQFVFSYQLND